MSGSTSEFVIFALTSVFSVVDPIGAVPTFLVLTERDSPQRRHEIALRATLATAAILMGFATIGTRILQAFHISLPAFRIAGGIVLSLVAIDMLGAHRITREGPGEVDEAVDKPDIAVIPLAVPMLAGPASLSTVTLLMSDASSSGRKLIVYVAITLTALATWCMLRWADKLLRILGKTGIHVFSRLLGLILLAIAVQLILDSLPVAKGN